MVLGLSQINGNGKSICQNLCFFPFFFFTAGVSDASEPRRRRVGAASEMRKKKGHRRTSETGASSPFRCPTRVGRGHDAKNGVSVQPS